MSSEIENVVTTNDALYRAFDSDPERADPQTKEILRYGEALWAGFGRLQRGDPMSPQLLIEIAQILKGSDIGVRAGEGCRIVNSRTKQVVYTPPAGSDRILRMLDELCDFLTGERDIEPMIAMAAAHRQFEAIHPFPDGNGRTGRVLNILALVQAGLLDVPVLYLSSYIVRHKPEYYKRLRAVTEDEDWEGWILFMLRAVEVTAGRTLQMLQSVHETMERWARVARERSLRGYSRELIEVVFSQPYTRIQHIERAGIAKRNAASRYLAELEQIGLLEGRMVGREHLYLNAHLLRAMTLEKGAIQ